MLYANCALRQLNGLGKHQALARLEATILLASSRLLFHPSRPCADELHDAGMADWVLTIRVSPYESSSRKNRSSTAIF